MKYNYFELFNLNFKNTLSLTILAIFYVLFNLTNINITFQNNDKIQNYKYSSYIPYKLKQYLNSETYFVIEKNKILWVFNNNTWVKKKTNLTNTQMKQLKKLIKKLKERHIPTSVKNKLPIKLKNYKIYYIPWYFS